MGAGAKCDPTRIQIGDISDTVYDPLARSVRRRLRSLGVLSGIPVVYSTEVPGDVKLLPLPEEEFQKGNVKELGVFDDFRVRILPVFGALDLLTTCKCYQHICRAPASNLWSEYSHIHLL
jgi:tRNA A37 threonylcarbamoyladenosine dehydratase